MVNTRTEKKIGRQFSWILIGRLTGALLQAVSMALLARWIGPSDFGLFASAYGVAILVQTVIDLGISTFVIRLRAQSPTDGAVGYILHIAGRVNLVAAIVGVAITLLISVADPRYIPLVPLALWLSADRQVETWLGVPLADGFTWQNASSLVLRRGGALLFLLIAAFLNINPLLGFTSGLAAFSVLSAYLVVRRNKPTVSTERTCRAMELIGLARPYWINSLGTQARNLDALVVAMILNPVSAGYYGAASRLTTPLRIIPTSFASVLMPAASRSSPENKRSLIKVTAMMAGFTSLLYLGLAVLLPFVVPVLLGNEFDEAIPVIQIVCGGLVFAAVASQFNALMQGWGYVRAVALISSATTVICLGGIALLSPILGVNGAGLALAFSYAIQVLVQVTYVYALSRRGDNAGGIC